MQLPFKDNRLLDYVDWNTRTGIGWADNEPFNATMRLVEYTRGYSSTKFVWQDVDTLIQYPMFVSDMFNLVKHEIIEIGEVTGTWIGVKKGANYGIKLAEEDW